MNDSIPALSTRRHGNVWAWPSSGQQAAALAIVLTFVWLAATAGIRLLTLPDEGRYVGVALEMLRSGHWATPTLDGLPFFHKPPLFYWLTATAMQLFGVNEWAARCASLLGAVGGSAALFLLARRWAGHKTAKLTLLVLVTQPLWFIGAQFANMDMLVAGCISATIVLLVHATLTREQGRPWRRALLAAYVVAALGVLAKGLIGAVIPALVLVVWLAAQKRWRSLAALVWLPGIAAFALVAMPWFVRMQIGFPDFLHFFIVVQHIERFAQGGFNNAEPAWFYFAVLPVLSLPWLVWLLAEAKVSYWRHVVKTPLLLLMWVWVAVVLVFFSLPQSKLLGYVLPAVPPLAFLMADAATRKKRPVGAMALLAGAVCVGLVFAVVKYQPRSNRELGKALAAERRPGEPLVYLDDYYYDLGFYAHQAPAPLVVAEWHSPDAMQHDNWRKELADAAAFAPAEARHRLIDEAALSAVLCSGQVTWVVAQQGASNTYPFLKEATLAVGNRDAALWRLNPASPTLSRSLGCAPHEAPDHLTLPGATSTRKPRKARVHQSA